MQKAQNKMMKQNKNKENPPNLEEDQVVHLKPNIRKKKTDPRGNEAIAREITQKTFKINNNIKRNKNKIKRIKKR